MTNNLLIVESPGKIRKLKSILGSGWDVRASVGHIRQLANDGVDSLGFDLLDSRISCRYVARDTRAKKTIADLRAAAKRADQVFIASDPDREGETIGWHVAEVLGLKNPQRVVYQEITQSAVRQAIAHPRPFDSHLISAGRCRECLDKLVGYRGSPLVWRLNNGAKSVGRVQSAALHLVCQREREITAFVSQNYWSVFVDYAEGFRAFYHGSIETSIEDAPIQELDDSGSTERFSESIRVSSQSEAEQLVQIAQSQAHTIQAVRGKEATKKPPAPFITSTLQQAAGSRLKLSPERTMQVAQKLYEAGLITYMRTDSVQLSPEFCAAARGWLQTNDPDNVPDKVTKQRSGKKAQEAHEAIRPTDLSKASSGLRQQLSEEEFKLYVLIWKRAIASQCKSARLLKSQIVTQSGDIQWLAKGQTVLFKGYSKYWADISADKVLPSLSEGQVLAIANAGHEQKQTQPPPRYTEPKLVQLMERKGIGRPSTYAPTIKTIKQRNYVQILKKKLQPTELGLEVDAFMSKALPELLESEFTAEMESQLDLIAGGKQEWEQYLIGWNQSYFGPAVAAALADLPALPKRDGQQRTLGKSKTKCPNCDQALSKVPTKSKKVKKGYFLKCEQGCKSASGEGDLVMFWSDWKKEWQQPGSQPSQSSTKPAQKTDFPCPVCKQSLEEYFYIKEGQEKSLLRCSDPKSRKAKSHKDVSFFMSRGYWWSKKFGELSPTQEN